MAEQQCDVLIVGAGPVGLVLAYDLSRLGHSVFIIDAVDKAASGYPMYGRACVLYSRTLEAYKDGKPIDRKWGIIDAPDGSDAQRSPMDTTFFKTILHVRLKYSEDILRRRLAEKGVQVKTPAELIDFQLDPAAADDYQVTASYKLDDRPRSPIKVRSRYIVGCDGAGSAVRRLAGIPFTGEQRKVEYWVRIDGIVRTKVPKAWFGLGAFESSTHGHVVWILLDHGATRVGYVLSEQLLQKYGTQMSAEDAAYEAQQAVLPSELRFERIDWYTVYGIQQNVVTRFHDHSERVLLAGDAAHTHSSGSGQGMNAGIQDVMNLSWRLAGTLRHWYRPEVLENYSYERCAVAQQLIDNDKIISALIAQRKPEQLQHRPEHAHVLLDEFLRRNSGFTTGLTISYGASLLNVVTSSGATAAAAKAICAGQRIPDALLQRSGVVSPKIRLYDIVRNNGKFRILIFVGEPDRTKEVLRILRGQVTTHFSVFKDVIDLVTIIPGSWHAFDERLGIERFGKAYWDPDSSAHHCFDISAIEGAMIVLRPDDVVGLIASLGGWDQVLKYFEGILVPSRSVNKS